MVSKYKSIKENFRVKTYTIFDIINTRLYVVVLWLFRLKNKLRKRKKVLIYTDSRGFEVTKPWNRRNPFSSYLKYLVSNYACTVLLCPEKYTSLLDFLSVYEKLYVNKGFDCVILHCGIVDFAPRPFSSFDEMYGMKVDTIKKFGLYGIIEREVRPAGALYQGEETYSFLNKEALLEVVIPRLVNVDNLIYIGVNRVLSDWNGEYWRRRPENINDQLLLDRLMHDNLKKTVDLLDLSDGDIRVNTSDNVHYTKEGFDYIYSKLKLLLPDE